jgi:hypothetical protein
VKTRFIPTGKTSKTTSSPILKEKSISRSSRSFLGLSMLDVGENCFGHRLFQEGFISSVGRRKGSCAA